MTEKLHSIHKRSIAPSLNEQARAEFAFRRYIVSLFNRLLDRRERIEVRLLAIWMLWGLVPISALTTLVIAQTIAACIGRSILDLKWVAITFMVLIITHVISLYPIAIFLRSLQTYERLSASVAQADGLKTGNAMDDFCC